MHISLNYPRVLSPLLALALTTAVACGGDDDDDAAGDDSAGTGVDAGADDCVETDVLPVTFRPIALVSTGELVTTPGENGETLAVIDATAGGFTGQADNPYIYIDLEAGTKVEIDDVEALSSEAWDIAFKRANIRINGGDSGPGGVEEAAVAAAGLADVTEAPPDSDFETDDWVDENCQLIPLADGTPSSAFGEWYDYDINTNTLTPKAEVHVVRTRAGQLIKLELLTYYGDENEPTRSAVYQVAWAPL